jgi:hypothetical protein
LPRPAQLQERAIARALKLRLLNVGSSNVLSSLVCDSTLPSDPT